ncbi:MAG: C4-type zinc ribbon domain-containing protein [Polyangiaceae bacterium]
MSSPSIPDQIRALEALASLDAELKTLADEIAQQKSALNTLKATLKKHEDKLTADRSALATLEKTKNDVMTDVRSMTQQLEHSREKMGRARTEREANAAQRELEELRKLLRDREEELGKLTADADAIRQVIEGTEGEAEKVRTELGASEGAIGARLSTVETEHASKLATREGLTKALPVVLFRRYDLLLKKRGSGIAQTTDGTCKACHMALPPQLYHRLRREPLLDQCQSCNRIIYFVPPTAARTDAADAKNEG